MKKREMAFEFVVEQLMPIEPVVRPMFGCHAVYHGEKIVLITRSKSEHSGDNGVWVATVPEHHASLKKQFPSLRSIRLLGTAETAWQNIPAEADDFEESVLRICELILKGDPRIGKIPKARKKKSSRPR
jgi:hypothetical protein